jgi:pimeloyl-ACP methyl ester carboxylesterase
MKTIQRLPIILLVLVCLLLAACAEPEAATPPTAVPPTPASSAPPPTRAPASSAPASDPLPSSTAELLEGDCPAAFDDLELSAVEVQCAYLIVPEDRTDPEGAQVELAVAILPSRSANPLPDPIIYLEGGPGGSALLGIESWVDSALRDERDLILFDQRGTGLSLPSLNCIEEEQGDDNGTEACRDRLLAEGINLNAYTSAANAADVADLISQLDYPEVNLLGISYGTRLALTVMRDNASGVRSVILDSPYPPQVSALNEQALNAGLAIQSMLRGCAADPDCDAAFPDLEARFYDLLERLNDEAILAEIVNSDGETEQIEVTGDDLVAYLSDWLYATDLIGYMPLLIAELDEGFTDTFVFLASEGDLDEGDYRRQDGDDEGDLSDSEGMYYSVECREEGPFGDLDTARELIETLPAPLADPLIAQVESALDSCDIWQVEPATPREGEPVRSSLPTLILAGEYDPVTPPWWGEIAAETLERSYFFVLPGGGHAVIDASDCMMAITKAFLANPNRAPDGSCLNGVRPIFELPE